MKKFVSRFLVLALLLLLAMPVYTPANAFAEDGLDIDESEINEESLEDATSISISPVSKFFQLSPSSEYEDVLKVTNSGKRDMRFETYTTPYTFTQNEDTGVYQLGFSRETNYTQIARWISFKNTDGEYTEKATYVAAPGETVSVTYRISTPSSLPAGGQYAVIFAHTISDSSLEGIRAEASPGMIVYGHADGETITSGEINNMFIKNTAIPDGAEKPEQMISASAMVKNTGNVDFITTGTLKVESVFGHAYYETPQDQARVSVIPETELEVTDKWEETPALGLFKVTWTVTNGDITDTITRLVFLLPAWLMIIMLLLLTTLVVWIIISIRKRKERRSKFAF